ncbi:MAG: hypothetical protein MZV65_35810 [Chromatiales bacterium]|nr:hypothetical protein [Chromatiales bacterium]
MPLSTATAQDSAVGLLKQMIAIAADNGGVGRADELNALKQQIAALPKPARGDTKKAQEANRKGFGSSQSWATRASQATLSIGLSDRSRYVLEYSGNLGFAYLKTGDLKAALKGVFDSVSVGAGTGRIVGESGQRFTPCKANGGRPWPVMR